MTITGANVSPETPAWREAFVGLQERAAMVFTAAIDGAVYSQHGTNFATRLTVIDKRPADDRQLFPARSGMAPDVATLLGWIERHVPPRLPVCRALASARDLPPAPRHSAGPGVPSGKSALPRRPALAEPEARRSRL